MAYFPFYIDIENKKILVVGGGTVALRKIEKLTPFSPDITVVAPKICDEIKALNVKIIDRRFCDSDLDGAFCVVSATDDETLNGKIFQLCNEKIFLSTQLTIRKMRIYFSCNCKQKRHNGRNYNIGQKSDLRKIS